MAEDLLSDVLNLVHTQTATWRGITADGAWATRGSVDDSVKFITVLRGRVRLVTDARGTRPVILESGDIALVHSGSWLEIRGRPEVDNPNLIDATDIGLALTGQGADIVVGGQVVLNPLGCVLLREALPPIDFISANKVSPSLHARVTDIIAESVANRSGSRFAIRQHGHLLLLDILRTQLVPTRLPSGWLRALSDTRLHPALALMHSRPDVTWRIDTLAKSAAMSRTSFAVRFRQAAGVTPLRYLSRYRMELARRALSSSDQLIGELASRLGYSSDHGFSTAFKREVGMSPHNYREYLRGSARERAQ